MNSRSHRISPSKLRGRIDATYFRHEFVENENRLRSSGLETLQLREVIENGRRAVYFSTDTLERPNAPDKWVQFLTADDLGDDGFFVDENARRMVSPGFADKYPNGLLRENELLVKVKGPNQITAYCESPPNERILVSGTLWGGLVKQKVIDPYYLVAALSSPYAFVARTRLRTNLNVEFLSPSDLLNLEFPTLRESAAQRYIGEKVRLARKLRRKSAVCKQEHEELVSAPEIVAALSEADTRTNRVTSEQIYPNRLDSKFYAKRAHGVFRCCSHASVTSVGALVEDVSNGFEERSFVEKGIDYVTVSEVSSGRLELANAPQISIDTTIPDKARISERCVLVVRSGSIGTAVKVHPLDVKAVIRSHLIRLTFDSDERAAVVAGFLNSEAGKCLLWKISYGAVQSQIGQDELLSLPIPAFCLEHGKEILKTSTNYEWMVRTERSLLAASKLLVEALIDRKLSEHELASAQTQFEYGDQSADRMILSRLYEGGIDATETRPLFPDLDAYYETLQMAEQALSDGGDT